MQLFGPQVIIPSSLGQPANGNSMATNITSEPVIIQQFYALSATFSWTGTTPIGTVAVQGSNDYSENSDGSVRNAGTWDNLVLNYGGSAVTSIPISGNSGNGLIDITATGIYAIQVIYTATSGTGNLTVTLNAKG